MNTDKKNFLTVPKLTAIVHCVEESGKKQQNFLKFYKIPDTLVGKSSFTCFVLKWFPTADYINFYNNETKSFVIRIYTNNFDNNLNKKK